jgi:hypothetical protein
MTDMRVDDTGPLPDSERLPWLEAVDEDDHDRGPSAGKLIAFVLIGLAAIGLIVGGLFWMGERNKGGGNGEPELIAAPAGDYKVKPDDPGGMEVEGRGDTAFATSEGANPRGAIDVNAVTEAPVARPKSRPTQLADVIPPLSSAAPSPAPAASATPAATASAPSAGGGAIQLGAFSSQAAANGAWKAMSGRFAYLAPLSQSVTPVTSNGRTLYRLRASGPGAAGICGRLRVAGEQCVVLD